MNGGEQFHAVGGLKTFCELEHLFHPRLGLGMLGKQHLCLPSGAINEGKRDSIKRIGAAVPVSGQVVTFDLRQNMPKVVGVRSVTGSP